MLFADVGNVLVSYVLTELIFYIIY